jgi:hypothetical protein
MGKELIHYADYMTFAAVWTACRQGMQIGQGKWHPEVNMWGQTGIVKTEGWKLIATDKRLVTCPKCKRRMNRGKKRIQWPKPRKPR